MNHANSATNLTTNDRHDPETRLDRRAGPSGPPSRKQPASRAYALRYPAGDAANQPISEMYADSEVREDKAFYVPKIPSNERHDANPKRYWAAVDHAERLQKAELLLHDVMSLVGLMLAALDGETDDRAMQARIGLRVIRKKLKKAHDLIDRHHDRHMNLFLAYFELKDKMGGDAE